MLLLPGTTATGRGCRCRLHRSFHPRPAKPAVLGTPDFHPRPAKPAVLGTPDFRPRPAKPAVLGTPDFRPRPAKPAVLGTPDLRWGTTGLARTNFFRSVTVRLGCRSLMR